MIQFYYFWHIAFNQTSDFGGDVEGGGAAIGLDPVMVEDLVLFLISHLYAHSLFLNSFQA
ncbi:hypothetical protein Lalb_Chr10g0103481 [Lupinus albus]|uniref:Uncharacterized protein n=1 Tax=Lupinus albus TaxID=3870 RepID=A0A6A4PWU3_LUPAL|nr:hypothetical protein Lalb_Chr10g0103481 [Lupinus albus]